VWLVEDGPQGVRAWLKKDHLLRCRKPDSSAYVLYASALSVFCALHLPLFEQSASRLCGWLEMVRKVCRHG
jgi:hypothetical protein